VPVRQVHGRFRHLWTSGHVPDRACITTFQPALLWPPCARPCRSRSRCSVVGTTHDAAGRALGGRGLGQGMLLQASMVCSCVLFTRSCGVGTCTRSGGLSLHSCYHTLQMMQRLCGSACMHCLLVLPAAPCWWQLGKAVCAGAPMQQLHRIRSAQWLLGTGGTVLGISRWVRCLLQMVGPRRDSRNDSSGGCGKQQQHSNGITGAGRSKCWSDTPPPALCREGMYWVGSTSTGSAGWHTLGYRHGDVHR
jgi:hypothetical protein